jgi:tetratricopeptide (TPR) repeat protein
MSLLLEALKKAEKAKEEAQRRANGGDAAAEAAAPAPPPAPEAARQGEVLTRDKLPDISSTLEIVSDDLEPSAPSSRANPEPTLEPLQPAPKPAASASAAAAPAASPRRGVPPADEGGRATARKVFEAKFREPNPRMPFYITLGVLGLFAVGTVVYFWYQLRPPAPLVNLNPPRPAETAVAASEPAARTVATAPATTPTPHTPAIPGLPGATPPEAPSAAAREPAAPVAAAPAPRAPAVPVAEAPRPPPPPETPKLSPRLPARLAAPVPAALPQMSTARSVPAVNPQVASGYEAYEAGDLGKARGDYEQALRDEPGNRDALLGLAALDVRAGRYEAAEALYLRVLQADPRDPQAQAALLSLRAGRSDPLATESRVKSLLAAAPEAPGLTFTLGNQLAQQNRWGEAHEQYLKAYTADPDNADYAYNVAVSLDHLHRTREALAYYQRAVTLARTRGASFDPAAAQARAAQLAR